MPYTTDDLRIKEIRELTPPSYLIREFPCGQLASSTVHIARHSAHDIIHGKDDRLLVIVGPCSIHDPVAAEEYAEKLSELRRHFADDLEIIMRVYFEKPRTTIGWKGLINDPDLDCSFHINHGLRLARELLLTINELGVPAGTEYLDMITPQYIADLISWVLSELVPQKVRCIVNWRAVFHAPSDSRTALTATSKLQLMPLKRPQTNMSSFPSLRAATPLLLLRGQ